MINISACTLFLAMDDQMVCFKFISKRAHRSSLPLVTKNLFCVSLLQVLQVRTSSTNLPIGGATHVTCDTCGTRNT